MRGLFVGGPVDNSELDLEGDNPPMHYPANGGAGVPRYRLSRIGRAGDERIVYAVYAAPDLADEEVARVSGERDYPRRFEARETPAQ